MQSFPSLLSDPLWPGVVAREGILFMGHIELVDIQTEYKQMNYAK